MKLKLIVSFVLLFMTLSCIGPKQNKSFVGVWEGIDPKSKKNYQMIIKNNNKLVIEAPKGRTIVRLWDIENGEFIIFKKSPMDGWKKKRPEAKAMLEENGEVLVLEKIKKNKEQIRLKRKKTKEK